MSTDTTEAVRREIDMDAEPDAVPPPRGVEFFAGEIPPRRRWFVIGLSVVLVAAAVSVITLRSPTSAEATVFRYAFTAGDTQVYDMQLTFEGTPEGLPAEEAVSGTMAATMTVTTVEVLDDGTAVVEVAISNVRTDGLPPGTSPPGDEPIRITVAPDGRVTSVDGEGGFFSMGTAPGPMGGATPADAAGGQFFFPSYPSEAIAPGDTWSLTHESPLPTGEETVAITVKGEHEGFQETSYGQAARIRQEVEVPFDIDLPLGELMDAMVQGFGEGMGGFGGPAPAAPNFSDARMVMEGHMAMDAVSLVLPETGDLVQLEGDMDMQMRFELVNFPDIGGAMPDSFGMNVTMHMQVIRIS